MHHADNSHPRLLSFSLFALIALMFAAIAACSNDDAFAKQTRDTSADDASSDNQRSGVLTELQMAPLRSSSFSVDATVSSYTGNNRSTLTIDQITARTRARYEQGYGISARSTIFLQLNYRVADQSSSMMYESQLRKGSVYDGPEWYVTEAEARELLGLLTSLRNHTKGEMQPPANSRIISMDWSPANHNQLIWCRMYEGEDTLSFRIRHYRVYYTAGVRYTGWAEPSDIEIEQTDLDAIIHPLEAALKDLDALKRLPMTMKTQAPW